MASNGVPSSGRFPFAYSINGRARVGRHVLLPKDFLSWARQTRHLPVQIH